LASTVCSATDVFDRLQIYTNPSIMKKQKDCFLN